MRPIRHNERILSLLSSVVLFLLVTPVTMTYTLVSSVKTPYILFTILFILLFLNIGAALFTKSENKRYFYQSILTWSVIVIVMGGVMANNIMERGRVAVNLNHHTHDIVLQLESAVRFLNKGVNPYATNYIGTPLESWEYGELGKPAVNPALFHFVMPPFYLYSAYPFYFSAKIFPGFFDGRMPLYTAAFLFLILFWFSIRDKNLRLFAIPFIAFLPGVFSYLIEGRSDYLVLLWQFAALVFLFRKKYIISMTALVLALTTKQSSWFFMPFYLLSFIHIVRDRKRITNAILYGLMLLYVIIGPFIVWDTPHFMESMIGYLSGNATHSYPIAGYGLGMVLFDLGIIKSIHEPFPFFYWQIFVSVPLLVFLLMRLRKNVTQYFVSLFFAFFLFVSWWGMRYFHNSHIMYIGTWMCIGIVQLLDSRKNS